MKLYVDDLRPPPPGWRLARTVQEAQDILGREKVLEVSLDYVIGAGATFEPVAHFIAALPEKDRPRLVWIHTSSGAGAAVMMKILRGLVREIRRV